MILLRDFKQKLGDLSALGAAAELAMPHIELRSNRQAVIEGCAGILEYEETCVRLNCGTLLVALSGSELCLEQLAGSLVCVSGELLTLSFSSL